MALKFSGCMRAHGVSNFPDPAIASNGLPRWDDTQIAAQAPAFKAARRACRHDLPSLAPQTPAEKAAANAAALKYATCMRSNGVPGFPDPNGQGLIQIDNGTGALAESSPQFQKAEAACRSLGNGFAEQLSAARHAPGGAGNGR
jgi:hypothetical protein